MSIQSAYDLWSASYDDDRNLTRDLDASVTQRVLGGLGARTVLEIGCGGGKNTVWLAQAERLVLALDFSLGMLRQAQRKLSAPWVCLAAADLTQSWPCAGQTFDLVSANLVLEHVSDLGFICVQAWRSLRLGGHFFVSELHPERQYLGVKAHFRRDHAVIEIPAFVHHLTDYLTAAAEQGFTLVEQCAWRHAQDVAAPPRLASFLFRKGDPAYQAVANTPASSRVIDT
jgi:malonyl-CoA O-methyltransferase